MYGRYRSGMAGRQPGYLSRYRAGRNRTLPADRSRYFYNFGNRRVEHYFYGTPHSYFSRPCRNEPREAKPVEKPKPPKEEIAKVLQVKGVDLKVKSNALKHRTSEYSLTHDYDEDGKHHDPECVVRRGDYMEMVIEFDRPYGKGKHDMKLCFECDEDGDETFETKRELVLNEDKREKFAADKWGANLIKTEGANKILVEVHIASNCIIGEWKFSITTIVEGKDQDGKEVKKKFTYEDDKLYVTILFNSWCKEDDVYCPDSKMCDEYVLNADGFVCTGDGWNINNKPWIFGQFENHVLDICLELLKDRFRPRRYHLMASPAIVARTMANVVNDVILYGRWDGEYDDGVPPWVWKSSAKILQAYWKSKSMVKYGQCWVFSGVLTGVCRALGIPCRSVTNFSSAHDKDESNTIDKYFTKDENGKVQLDKFRTNDSIWNFHVWNEIYIRRPDIDKSGKYDGWQAIDSTPQEASDGIYTCGPAPIKAVQEGNCRMDYDCGFVFSEINADEVYWLFNGEKFEPFMINKGAIGRNISTKRMGSDEREDVTSHYKHKEGSEEERKAVEMAYLTARKPKKGAYHIPKIKKVKFNLIHSSDVMIGDNLDITVKATNNGRHTRKISNVQLVIEAETYTGEKVGSPIKDEKLGSKQIASGKVETFSYTLDAKTYLPLLVEGCNIRILAMCSVEGLADEEEENEVKDHQFVFKKPGLTIGIPKKTMKKGETMKVALSFQNPLNEKLEVKTLTEDTIAFDLVKGRSEENQIKINKMVDPKAWFKRDVEVVARRSTPRGLISFTIDSDKIYDITGTARIEVTE